MVSKTIIAGLVAIAFVAGSITTGAMAYAAPNGQPFQELWDAIDEVESLIINLSVGWESIQDIPADFADGVDNVDDNDSDPINEIQSLSLSGQDLTISGGNTVTLPTGGSSLSCDNQYAIATAIPAFLIEPQCLQPLSVEVDDLTYPGVILGGGISHTCNTTIPVTISGGQSPVNFSWELISINPTASLFAINGIPATVEWAVGLITSLSVAELELTVSEGGGTTLVIPVTLSCVT